MGKRADIILVDPNHPHMVPRFNLPSALVYQANGSEVVGTIVDGRVLMERGQLVGLDREQTDELLLAAMNAADGVIDRAGMSRIRDRGWRSEADI